MSMSAAGRSATTNPFKMPTDEEVFILRDEEKRQKRLDRERLKYKRVHEKTTWSASMASARTGALVVDDGEGQLDGDVGGSAANLPGTDVQLPTVEKRLQANMTQYITKKRKLGLARMSLATKRQEIKKLDEEAEHAEKRVAQMREQLKETEGKFNAFLEYTELEHKNAANRAEEETKLKQEKMQEIKKVSSAIAQIETDKRKNEEQLSQCRHFKEFLDRLIPVDWLRDTLIQLRQEDARNLIAARLEREFTESLSEGMSEQEEMERQERKKQQLEAECETQFAVIENELREQQTEEADELLAELNQYDADRVPMYFTKPEQIFQKFVDIEEGNLFLITTCQEYEALIEGIAAQYKSRKQEMTELAKQRHAQMEGIRRTIQAEQVKLDALHERLNRAQDRKADGQEGPKTQDAIKNMIADKVRTIYENLFPKDDASNVGTLGALTQIEVRLDEMRVQINDMERAYVAQVLRQRDKDRRQAARQVLIAKQKKERDERSLRMLERSTNPVEKRVGKPVMWRSRPLDHKKQETTAAVETNKNEDDEFFN